jgi:hypothetical protein
VGELTAVGRRELIKEQRDLGHCGRCGQEHRLMAASSWAPAMKHLEEAKPTVAEPVAAVEIAQKGA